MSNQEIEGIRFLRLECENFKKLKPTMVDIGGRSFCIIGPNAAGKSSVVQALLSSLDVDFMPPEPIKTGEQRATVKVVLGGIVAGEKKTYTLETYFTPGNKRGRLVLFKDNGEKVTSGVKSILDNLIGSVSFNVFDWLHEKKEKKIQLLKQLTGVGPEIDSLNAKKATISAERTKLNADIGAHEGMLKNHGFTPEEVDKYSEAIFIAPIEEELNGISEKIDKHSANKTKVDGVKKAIAYAEKLQEEASARLHEIARLIKNLSDESELIKENAIAREKEIDELKKKEKIGDEWLATHKAPSASEIAQRLSDANKHNENHKKVIEFSDKQKALYEMKKTYAAKETEMQKVEDEKTKVIQKSKLPIEGLTFSDDDILVDGLPMDDKQINTGKLMEIEIEVKIALNPRLKAIFIHDASLLDRAALSLVFKKAEARGYQIIAEVVSGNKGDDAEIKFLEYSPKDAE
jgi:AAA ATPase domain